MQATYTVAPPELAFFDPGITDVVIDRLKATTKVSMDSHFKAYRKSPTAQAWNDLARLMFTHQQVMMLRPHQREAVARAVYGAPNYLIPRLIGQAVFGDAWASLKPDYIV